MLKSGTWRGRMGQLPGVIETEVKEFKIGVESELRKDKHFREGIGTLKED